MDENTEKKEKKENFDESELDASNSEDYSKLLDKEEEISSEAYDLLEHALSLADSQYFDDSLDALHHVRRLYEKINRKDEIKAINEKISEIYILKEQAFRDGKIEFEIKSDISDKPIIGQKVKEFEDYKRRENEISTQSYDLMGKGSQLAKNHQYDQALKLYEEAANLFNEINWPYELQKVKRLIKELNYEKASFFKTTEKIKLEKQKEIEYRTQQEALIDEKAKKRSEKESQVKLKRRKEIEGKKKEEEAFKNQISEMVDKAEKIAREYDIAFKKGLREGKIPESSPYLDIIQIYKEVRMKLREKGWKDQISIYSNQIKIYENKLEKDKKVRHIEAQKAEKQKEFDDMYKTKKVVKPLEPLKPIKMAAKDQKKEILSKRAFEMIDKAEKLAKKYEIDLKKGELPECVYGEVIDKYRKARTIFEEISWNDQATRLLDPINYYKKKLESDKKARILQAERIKLQEQESKAQEELLLEARAREKERREEREKLEQMKKLKSKKEQEIANRTFKTINEAEALVKQYKTDLKEGKISECPYERVVEIYREATNNFKGIGWNDQATRLLESINYYKKKLELDKKARNLQAERIKLQEQESKAQEELLLEARAREKERREELAKLERNKKLKTKKEEEVANRTYKKIDEAEALAKHYEADLKEGKTSECPYERVVEVYKEATKNFERIGWNDQAAKLLESINYYKKKLESDRKARSLQAERIILHEQELKEQEKLLLEARAREKERREELAKLERNKKLKTKKEEEVANRTYKKIDEAEALAKHYEADLKEGKLLECPYERVVEVYKEATKNFEGIGWNDQAAKLLESINYYKKKLESDRKARSLQAERIILHEQELKEQEELLLEARAREKERREELAKLERNKKLKTKKEEEVANRTYKKIDEAEALAKHYEADLKEGKTSECPYERVVGVYKEATKNFERIGWNDQAAKLLESINYYKKKLESDRKARSLQAERIILHEQELKEQEKLLLEARAREKERREELAKLERNKKLKTKKEEEVANRTYKKIDEAESLAKQYEADLKEGKLLECPYERVIEVYKEATKNFEGIGWNDQAAKLLESINYYKKKLESDRKARSLQAERIILHEQELKAQEELLLEARAKEEERREEWEKLEQMKKLKSKKEEEVANRTYKKIDEAESLAKQYEADLKEGKLLECPYERVVEIYREATNNFERIGWNDQAAKLLESINYYKKKLESDRKARSLQAERIKLQEQELKAQEELLLEARAKEEERREELAKLEQMKKLKSKKEQKMAKKIFDKIDEAEALTKQYEADLKEGKLPECPYERVVEIYREATNNFEGIGWNDQAATLINTIKYYTRKSDSDRKIRALRAERIKLQEQELKAQEELLLEARAKEEERREELAKLEQMKKLKSKKEQKMAKKIFDKIDEAEALTKQYEADLKEGKLPECPYERVVEIYREATNNFEGIGWNDQAATLINTINYYKGKAESDKKVRALKAERIQLQEQELKEQEKALLTEKIKEKERREELAKLERLKKLKSKKEQEVAKKTFETIDEAEALAKQYEADLKEGKLPECVYGEVINKYREARAKFEEIGWKDQVTTLINTTNYYKGKLESDKKVRALKAGRIKMQEQELKEQEKALLTEKMKEKKHQEELAKLERMKEVKAKKEHELSDRAFTLIDEAEALVKQYEAELKEGKPPECVYGEVIDKYRVSRAKFEEIGWKDQAITLLNTINYYKGKLESDKKVRALRAERIKSYEQEVKEQREAIMAEKMKVKEQQQELAKLERMKELKARKERELSDRAFELIEEAEDLAKQYELDLDSGELPECVYSEVIGKYVEARAKFEEIGWNEQAITLLNTMDYYKEKLESDKKVRALRAERIKSYEQEVKKQREAIIAKKMKVKEQQQELAKLENIKELKARKERELSDRAFELIEEAEDLAKQYELDLDSGELPECVYSEVIGKYVEARAKFEEIGWNEQAITLLNTMDYYKEKLEADNEIRVLRAERIKLHEQELKELKEQQRLDKIAKEKEEKLFKQKEKVRLLKAKEEEARYEALKAKAFSLLDSAKIEMGQNNFDRAIEFYNESEKIFSEISWQEGIKMVKESIISINKKKKRYLKKQEEIKEQEAQKLLLGKQLEEKIAKSKDLEKLQQEKRRIELAKIQEQKDRENTISEKAFYLLEQGTILLDHKKFQEALENYIEARNLFNEIKWFHEVHRINNELLFNLKKEQKKVEKFEKEKKKIELLKIEEEKRKKLETLKREEERKKLKKLAIYEIIDKSIMEDLERANRVIESQKYNEGILQLKNVIKKMKKSGKDEELEKIYHQVDGIKNQSHVPLITLEEIDINENMEKFFLGYQALDKAGISISENSFMRAVSELNEAKFNLKDTKIDEKFSKKIDDLINSCKGKLGVKPVKDLFQVKEEVTKTEEEILKARIAARREERKRKVLDLLGKK